MSKRSRGHTTIALVLAAVTCGPPAMLIALGLVIFGEPLIVKGIAGGLILAAFTALLIVSIKGRRPALQQQQ